MPRSRTEPETRPTWTEEHRAACEARTVMRWGKAQRSAYYRDVEKKRGRPALDRLIADVKREWERSGS